MKKIRLAGLLMLAPVVMMTGCGGAIPLSFATNWYANTALGADIGDTLEQLEYKVEFSAPSSANPFTVTYQTGTYVTTLKSEVRALSEELNEMVYVYTTQFNISGQYSLDGKKGAEFTDSVTSEIVFRNTAKRLAPVSSKKTVVSTAPTSLAPVSIETAYATYRYTYETQYDLDLTKVTTTYTPEKGEKRVSEVALGSDGTYLDNEQILFALRGINLSTVASFRTLNTVAGGVQTVSTLEPTTTEYELTGASIDGVPQTGKISAIKAKLAYQTTYSGPTRTLWYAKMTSSSANVYRNVLLRMEDPLLYGLGTLNYTLSSAQFANK